MILCQCENDLEKGIHYICVPEIEEQQIIKRAWPLDIKSLSAMK